MCEVIAVNRSARLALTDADEAVPLTIFLDEDGEDTSDALGAAIGIGQTRSGKWLAIDLREFEAVTVN